MKQWWQSKTQQEHLALILGAAAILILLVYLVIWLPFTRDLDKKAQRLESQTATLHWMQENIGLVQRMRAAQGGSAKATNEALLTLVDRTAKTIRLRDQIERIKPQGDRAVQLWIEQAPFDILIRWLGQLTEQHGLEIESMNIDRQDGPGLVNARVVIQRGGQE
ncbi:MAG: type II secretion system protein M [Candidatus Thiodiazotropha sp.]